MKANLIGIYKLEDVKTGNVYVGSSRDIAKRWSNHKANFKKGKHTYKQLQDAYNTNPIRIKYEMLELCSENDLEYLEDYYIRYCNLVDGWTVINKSNNTKTHTVQDTSNMKKAQTGENNPHNTKLSENDVKQIKMLLLKGVSVRELAEQYCVSRSLIYNIRTGRRWASVKIDDENYKPIITITKENEHVLHPKMTDERRKKIALMQKRADIISENMTVSKASLPVLEGRAAEKFLEDMKRAKLDPKIFKGAKQRLRKICDELGL